MTNTKTYRPGAWYRKIVDAPSLNDALSYVIRMDEYYTKDVIETDEFAKEADLNGLLNENLNKISGQIAYRGEQYNELRGVYRMLDIELDAAKSEHYVKYNEHYSRQLTHTQIDKYINGEDNVRMLRLVLNRIEYAMERLKHHTETLRSKQYAIQTKVKMYENHLQDIFVGDE